MKFIKYFIVSLLFLLHVNLNNAAQVLKKSTNKKTVVTKPQTQEQLLNELIKKTYANQTKSMDPTKDRHYSPDLKKYVTLSIDKPLKSTKITIFDGNKLKQIDLNKKLILNKTIILSYSWSRNSKYLILNTRTYHTVNYKVLIINTDDLAIKSLPVSGDWSLSSKLSPNNSLFAHFCVGQSCLKIEAVNKTTNLYNDPIMVTYPIADIAWSRNNLNLAILLDNNTIHLLNKNLKSGKWIKSKKTHTLRSSGNSDNILSLDWSPDNSKLILNLHKYTDENYKDILYYSIIYDIKSGKELIRFNTNNNTASKPYWVREDLINFSNGSQIKLPSISSIDLLKILKTQPKLLKYVKKLINQNSPKIIKLLESSNNFAIKSFYTNLIISKFNYTVQSLINLISEQNKVYSIIQKEIIDSIQERFNKLKLAPTSQTRQHLFKNLIIITNLFKKHVELKKKKIADYLVKIYSKEETEFKKGNYVFYHGRRRKISFISAIYKKLREIKENQKIKDNFVFFRFNNLATPSDNRTDYLFMNHALFGNAHESTMACTLTQYFLNNTSVYSPPYSSEQIFKQFNLLDFYNQNLTDLTQLQNLYVKASKYGEIVMVSIPAKYINKVRLVSPGGYPTSANINGKSTKNTKEVLDAIRAGKKIENDDYFEWSIPATTQYLLDPINGPDVYSFQLNDEKLMREYNELSNKIFEKLKTQLNPQGMK